MAGGAPNVRRDHRGVDVPMAESCLDRPNIGTDFGHRCGTRVPRGMTARSLGDRCFPYSRLHGVLHHQSTHMMPPMDTCERIERMASVGKSVLPRLFPIGMRVFSLQGVCHLDAPHSLRQVLFMKFLDCCRLCSRGALTCRGSMEPRSLSTLPSATTSIPPLSLSTSWSGSSNRRSALAPPESQSSPALPKSRSYPPSSSSRSLPKPLRRMSCPGPPHEEIHGHGDASRPL